MKRKIQRIFFYPAKFLIGLFNYYDARLYMRLYIVILKLIGLKLNGVPRYISPSAKFDDYNLISLGNRVVISSNVIFLTHDYSFTTGLISIDEIPKTDIGILGPISIGENVFIGLNSIILPGTSIGNNVIVGAGSVVRGKIPDNVVISGNPANIITDIKSHIEKLKTKNYLKRIDFK